ncbi:MAG: hypothetical protein GY860_12245 [Desulfobacteraceae bacterium]|nr:hypothetical protein [Desulfobacteraceae bacterium]
MIKVKTDGFSRELLKKIITVLTNDGKNSKINLTISGIVEKIVTISPKRVSLVGVEGEDLQAVVKVIPDEKYSFKILDIISNEKSNINYQLTGIKKLGKLEYVIEIQNLKKNTGYYKETIVLKTDSSIKPEIKIKCSRAYT